MTQARRVGLPSPPLAAPKQESGGWGGAGGRRTARRGRGRGCGLGSGVRPRTSALGRLFRGGMEAGSGRREVKLGEERGGLGVAGRGAAARAHRVTVAAREGRAAGRPGGGGAVQALPLFSRGSRASGGSIPVAPGGGGGSPRCLPAGARLQPCVPGAGTLSPATLLPVVCAVVSCELLSGLGSA